LARQTLLSFLVTPRFLAGCVSVPPLLSSFVRSHFLPAPNCLGMKKFQFSSPFNAFFFFTSARRFLSDSTADPNLPFPSPRRGGLVWVVFGSDPPHRFLLGYLEAILCRRTPFSSAHEEDESRLTYTASDYTEPPCLEVRMETGPFFLPSNPIASGVDAPPSCHLFIASSFFLTLMMMYLFSYPSFCFLLLDLLVLIIRSLSNYCADNLTPAPFFCFFLRFFFFFFFCFLWGLGLSFPFSMCFRCRCFSFR